MNILLMGMPDICFGYPTEILTTPNLGLSSIAANVDKRHRVKIADLVLKRKDVKGAIEQALNMTTPQLVGLSAMTFQYKTALKIAAFIKRRNPEIIIALGGYHATLMFEEIAESPDGDHFDLIFRGESDLSFNEAVNALEDDRDLSLVDGLSFKRNGKFIHNKPRKLEDLSQIELPDRSARLWNDFGVLKVPWDMIEFSRGCLMTCNFCNIRNMYGRSFRAYDVERVLRDIEQLKKSGIKMALFSDDNITSYPKRLANLCDAIIQSGHNDMIFGVQVSAIGIASSEELVKKMAKAGFRFAFLGVESASKKNLAELSKGDIVDKSKMAVQYLQENDFMTTGGFIIGNPEDDYQDLEETYKFAKSLKTDFTAVQILVPYPKTGIREKLMRQGLVVCPDDFEMYDGGHPIVKTTYLDENQLFSARYIFGKKYLHVRVVNVFRAIWKFRKDSFPFVKGSIKLIPKAINAMLSGWIKRLFLSEKQMVDQHMQRVLNVNKFNI